MNLTIYSSDNFNSIAIDIKGNVWIIICPDHPFLLKSDLINNGHADSTPIQVVCNYYYSAILTRSGDVYIVYPFDEYARKEHEKRCEESETEERVTTDLEREVGTKGPQRRKQRRRE